MKNTLLLIAAIICTTTIHAQTLSGVVTETGSNTKLPEVFIKNLSKRGEVAFTDKNGKYSVRASTGNTLVFASPGYVSDTLFVTDMRNKYISLTPASIALREVNITASRKFNPRAEYPEVYSRSKVYPLSPTTWLSRSSGNARRLKRYFEWEEHERAIDSAFSRAYVGSIVPLKGAELENFMTLYRPTYAFLRSNTGPSMASYLNDSYKKWQALPPSKRKLPSLVSSEVQPQTP